MKKFALLLVIALLMGTACAESSLVSSVEYADWIDGTNLLRVETDDGYAMADINGNLITEAVYSSSFRFDGGLVTAYKADDESMNAMGALRLDGTVAIPFQYGDVRVFSSEWAAGITLVEATRDNYDYESWSDDTVYLIENVDIYNLVTGAKLTLPRANYADAGAVGHSLNIEDRATAEVTTYDADFNVLGTGLSYTSDEEYAQQDLVSYRENGRYGLKDGEGNVVMEPAYSYIYSFYGDYAKVEIDDKYGIISKDGVEVIPAIYDDFETSYYLPTDAEGESSGYCASGYFCMEKDGKLGYATAAGVTCEPKYSVDILDNNGASATFTDMEGNFNILAADGVITPVTGYDRVSCAYYGNGFYYTVRDADYNTGLIDWHGNVVFPCQYDGISLSGDGQYALLEIDYGEAEIHKLSMAVEAAPAAMEIPAAEAAPAAQEHPAKALLESAKALLAADAAANAAAVAALLDSAIAML